MDFNTNVTADFTTESLMFMADFTAELLADMLAEFRWTFGGICREFYGQLYSQFYDEIHDEIKFPSNMDSHFLTIFLIWVDFAVPDNYQVNKCLTFKSAVSESFSRTF